MDIEAFREYCLSVKASSESCPFIDHTVLAFKVMDKIFAYIALEPKDGMFRANMKCDPEWSAELREQYRGIESTQFKTLLWNTIYLDSDVPDSLIRELINHAAEETVKKLPKKRREEYYQL